VNPKGQTRDHNTLSVRYLENSWTCYLETNQSLITAAMRSTVGYPRDSLASYCQMGAGQWQKPKNMKYYTNKQVH